MGMNEAPPNDLVKGFLDAGWASFAEGVAGAIIDPVLSAELGRTGRETGPPPDLLLSPNPRLEHLPWEALELPGGTVHTLGDLAVFRFCYRSIERPKSTDLPVRWLQAALNNLVAAGLSVDGLDGPVTREAIRRFQRESGLEPSGVGDPETLAAIDRCLVAGTTGRPSRACFPGERGGPANGVSRTVRIRERSLRDLPPARHRTRGKKRTHRD